MDIQAVIKEIYKKNCDGADNMVKNIVLAIIFSLSFYHPEKNIEKIIYSIDYILCFWSLLCHLSGFLVTREGANNQDYFLATNKIIEPTFESLYSLSEKLEKTTLFLLGSSVTCFCSLFVIRCF